MYVRACYLLRAGLSAPSRHTATVHGHAGGAQSGLRLLQGGQSTAGLLAGRLGRLLLLILLERLGLFLLARLG